MTFIGGLNQFKAIANLTLSKHFLEKKNKLELRVSEHDTPEGWAVQ